MLPVLIYSLRTELENMRCAGHVRFTPPDLFFTILHPAVFLQGWSVDQTRGFLDLSVPVRFSQGSCPARDWRFWSDAGHLFLWLPSLPALCIKWDCFISFGSFSRILSFKIRWLLFALVNCSWGSTALPMLKPWTCNILRGFLVPCLSLSL